ncbi:hypothetical protein LCGC14_1802120 [marine sediment metagenome]|uniref:HTH cro/C1-type domain-containing protein n=1 Tax=marine sediment metagenome TaxID=412755 RepID=A0A0F9GP34_9ZZZZ
METIKEIRNRLGYTQKQFGELLGVDQVTVNRWENDKTRPSKLAQRQLDRLRR